MRPAIVALHSVAALPVLDHLGCTAFRAAGSCIDALVLLKVLGQYLLCRAHESLKRIASH